MLMKNPSNYQALFFTCNSPVEARHTADTVRQAYQTAGPAACPSCPCPCPYPCPCPCPSPCRGTVPPPQPPRPPPAPPAGSHRAAGQWDSPVVATHQGPVLLPPPQQQQQVEPQRQARAAARGTAPATCRHLSAIGPHPSAPHAGRGSPPAAATTAGTRRDTREVRIVSVL